MGFKIVVVAIVALALAAPAFAQEVVSREDALADEEAVARGGRRRNNPTPAPVPSPTPAPTPSGPTSNGGGGLGPILVVARTSALYDSCAVDRLRSLFNSRFNIAPQLSVFSIPDATALPSSPNAFDYTRVPPSRFNRFQAEFAALTPPSAPTFLARLTGTIPRPIGSQRRFNLPFLCTLNPSASRTLQTADCISDLKTLDQQGVTGIGAFLPAPLNFFTLSIGGSCSAEEIVFVGTDVEESASPIPGDTSVNNQVNIFFGTKI